MKKNWAVLVSLISLGSPSCSHFPKGESGGEKVTLRLKSEVGRKELTSYHSRSHTKNFEEDSLERESDEAMDFKVLTVTTRVDPSPKALHMTVSVPEKDGPEDLHDLAFPEKGELLQMVYLDNADVVYAGPYPRTSLFFIPPLSLPKDPVQVGDTWEMVRSWQSLKNGMPLKISIVSILKRLEKCGDAGQCAVIEVSGKVEVLAAPSQTVKFGSEVQGLIWFSVDKGTVLGSQVLSQEQLVTEGNRVMIDSCLVSEMLEPKPWAFHLPKNLVDEKCLTKLKH